MKSLKEWQEEQVNEEHQGQQAPMDVVQQTMSRIAPLIIHAHQQIEGWPEERDKKAARRTLDAQLMKASRDQWMGRAKQISGRMGQGMDASRAMKQFGGVSTTAANQLAN